jgi:hypothetical protein
MNTLFAACECFVTRAGPFAVVVAALLAAGGYAVSTHLKIGDLDAGAPELRPVRATTATTPTSRPLRRCRATPSR